MTTQIFDGILMVSDLDGTLLNSKSQISRENRAALEYFVAHGGLFTVATGRTEESVQRFLPDLPLNAPGIVYNGAVIYDWATQRIRWEVCLPEAVKAVIADLCAAFPGLGVEIFHYREVHFPSSNPATDQNRYQEGFLPRITRLAEVPFPWVKIILAGEPVQLRAAELFLTKRRGLFRMVYSELRLLELLPVGASKGSALQKLLPIIGRDHLKVVALGDNLNDLEMITTAGLGIAVANAHPRLKEAARYCCGHHDQHAVAQVITRLERGII